jgi:hypothetical protein
MSHNFMAVFQTLTFPGSETMHMATPARQSPILTQMSIIWMMMKVDFTRSKSGT